LSIFLVVEGYRKKRALLGWIQGAGLFLGGGAILVALPFMVHLPDPVAMDLRTWGLLCAIGMFTGFFVQRGAASARGIDPEDVFNLWIYGGTLGLVLSRALHVAVNWDDYRAAPLSALSIFDGGLVFLGALVGYLGFVLVYTAWRRLPRAELFDALALGLPFGHAIARIGCFLAGCCWGRPTALPLGVHFPEGALAFASYASRGLLPAGATATPALHPTELYEATFGFALGAYLVLRARRRDLPAGAIACLYLILYSVGRFFIEMLRDDPDRSYVLRLPAEVPLLLSTSQVLSVGLALLALWSWKRLERSPELAPTL
jgi:phosphatidylglycerol:prolipoprotein diacylglycerol transferase